MYNIHPSAMQLLIPLYNSPQRKYHDFNHIQYCISKLSEYDEAVPMRYAERTVATYSIFFHDAIYSPYRFANSSNERESADLFMKWFNSNEIEVPSYYKDHRFGFAADVCQAITATENHVRDLTEYEWKSFKVPTLVMLDVDMAGFAKLYAEVFNDSDRVFAEYEVLGIPYETMLHNRIQFLERLLLKKRIYATDHFYANYERIARENIALVIEDTRRIIGLVQ